MFSEPDIQVSYHPLFGSPDADVVFRSSEGTYYRLHSFVLRTTSGFFRPMLSLSGSGSSPDLSSDASPIGLEEKDGVLARFFTMISGMEIPQWDTLDEIEDVLHAAEKYDTPGPISIIRSAITSPRFMLDPLRVYAIAARSQEYIPVLKRIPTDDLLRLIDLRRERRDAFIHAIDNEVHFTSGCSRDKYHHPWYALKLSVYMEMDERPIVRNMNDLDWEVAKKCWSHKYTYCGRLVYNQIATMECIRPCVDKLPLQLRPRI
ncbi:hypothetical protein BDR05DRAFT_975988 [Suillus weaverae]|nr:hypothetical protein BDR05DRAFT_975988 [Suillus weaverae]